MIWTLMGDRTEGDRSETCIYTHLTDDIHQFAMLSASHTAIDAWFARMSVLYDELAGGPPPDRVAILIDVRRSGMLPLHHTASKLRDWLTDHPGQVPVKVAIVYPPDFLLNMAEAFTRMLRLPQQVRFFPAGEYTAAVDWLRTAQ